jgi:PadR family transcriptional regulator PadR
MGDRPPSGELLPGTLDMLILKTLTRGEMHGYGIAQSIQRASDDVLHVEEGALYPALHRLEVRGWLRSTWGTSENNRRAKFYRLTRAGRKQVEKATRDWELTTSILAQFLQPKPEV